MRCRYACGTAEHVASRRTFLSGLAAGFGAAAGIAAAPSVVQSAVASQLAGSQKRILTVFLHGGLSQLESWDPKPNTDTGGPFRAIPTSVPGVHISELLPLTARQMHRLALVRGINTRNNSHGTGQYEMCTGHKKSPAADYTHLGAMAAKLLTPDRFPLPGHVLIKAGGSGNAGPAWLGPRYAAVTLEEGQPPTHTTRPTTLAEATDLRRNAFRSAANDQ
ncbi:MAG TPA: DUF1501 domain-containing protein, partial [Pirellulales bacterium]|nr:DUF1501 domain-containing protein [Pirellulales bacterium]